ncbi:916_t:CDS:2 [Acaulospora colombiana]|uniref:916_t:CDS:1 n=1 Tax=Acaulospora colombiana TaxID=27376 RepID=A0ACA9M1Z3_9GLOM|nr:916_t:CDS:2 [Acaulospora colombiana]
MHKKNYGKNQREKPHRNSAINDENESGTYAKEEILKKSKIKKKYADEDLEIVENEVKTEDNNSLPGRDKRKKDLKLESSVVKSKRKKGSETEEAEDNTSVDDMKVKKRKTEKDSFGIKEENTKNSSDSSDMMKGENEKEMDEIPENLRLTSYRLSQGTIDSLKKRGVVSLFPIQASTFDLIYDGKDVLARAKTGTGKTLAFALPITEALLKAQKEDKYFRGRGRPPKVIVMTPTRDLAKQVSAEFESIAPSLKVLCIYGGVTYDFQHQGLREGIDVLVGTPGRVLDHIERGSLKLADIKFVVLDEADQMLDIGFAEAMETVLQNIKRQKENQDRVIDYQTLLFSATIPDWVRQAIKSYLKADYENVDLIVNADTKTNDIAQPQREVTMKCFREGKFKCIICTDVLARGIDIPQVVINCEPPKDIESYVHRAGRTARAGRQGTAVTFFKPQEENLLMNIQRRTGIVFQMMGPPQPQDIIAATANDVIKSIGSVESTVLSYFHKTATDLIESQGAVEALSAALACMSGYAGGIKKRSLMSAVEGYTTLLFRFTYPIRHSSYARSIFKNHYPQLSEDSVKAFKLTKDMQGVACDISSDKLEIGSNGEIILAGKPWVNTKNATLEIAKDGRSGGRGYGRRNFK